MEITVTKTNDRRWAASISIEGFSGSAVANRPGCAVREVMNQMQYVLGSPDSDFTVTIEGW